MKYIKVKWMHNFLEEPIYIYSEFDDNYCETRKIEIYANGTFGYANKEVAFNGSILSEKRIPTIDEIAKDSQFVPKKIKKEEFESMYKKIVDKKTNTIDIEDINGNW